MAMTWNGYTLRCAKRLAECRARREFNGELAKIDETLSENRPPDGVEDFWSY